MQKRERTTKVPRLRRTECLRRTPALTVLEPCCFYLRKNAGNPGGTSLAASGPSCVVRQLGFDRNSLSRRWRRWSSAGISCAGPMLCQRRTGCPSGEDGLLDSDEGARCDELAVPRQSFPDCWKVSSWAQNNPQAHDATPCRLYAVAGAAAAGSSDSLARAMRLFLRAAVFFFSTPLPVCDESRA